MATRTLIIGLAGGERQADPTLPTTEQPPKDSMTTKSIEGVSLGDMQEVDLIGE